MAIVGMNEFEKASELAMQKDGTDFDGTSSNEYAIEWVGRGKDATATVCFPSSSGMATKIRKLAEKNPDDVQILSDKGNLVAHIPVKAIHISIRSRELTDEQRQAAADRLSKARAKRFGNSEVIDEDFEDEDFEDEDFDDEE